MLPETYFLYFSITVSLTQLTHRAFARQLTNPVLWEDSVKAILREGVKESETYRDLRDLRDVDLGAERSDSDRSQI